MYAWMLRAIELSMALSYHVTQSASRSQKDVCIVVMLSHLERVYKQKLVLLTLESEYAHVPLRAAVFVHWYSLTQGTMRMAIQS
jgi:hypothetical protein